MGLVMIISLYATRVVLDVLGEDDYGIYNVVGGVVVMFSFLSRTLASASQRYFAFEIGRGDYDKLNKVFNINLILFAIVIGIVSMLAEAAFRITAPPFSGMKQSVFRCQLFASCRKR